MTSNPWQCEITIFTKASGILSKKIGLRDGKLVKDDSACRMANGTAHRVTIDSMQALADLINGFGTNEAYALGRLKDGHPDHCQVVRKDKLNGAGDPSIIARSKDYLVFKDGPGVVLLDTDFKGMSEDAKRRFDEVGGLWGALCEVLPAFEDVACVERASTSSGLRNTETGETFAGFGGRHIVLPVLDATDIPRFLENFHARAWLHGFGWGMVSADGKFLERSIVDISVGSPERLIFEGAPIIEEPLEQLGREAIARDGATLDTRSWEGVTYVRVDRSAGVPWIMTHKIKDQLRVLGFSDEEIRPITAPQAWEILERHAEEAELKRARLCAPLTDAERAELQKLIEAEKLRLLPERQQARAAWSVTHIQRLVARGMSEDEARKQVDRWIDQQELSGDFPLPFDDPKFAGTTVEQVLARPDEYVEKTLSDPFEGPDYGRGKAIIFKRADGSLFINSFAHGGIVYELKKKPSQTALPLRPYIFRPFKEIPRRPWLHAGHYIRRHVVMTVAPGGYGKTSLVLCNALEMTMCRGILGPAPRVPLSVAYWNAEDTDDEIERLIAAICLRHNIDPIALQGRLFLGSKIIDCQRIAHLDHNQVVFNEPVLKEIKQYIGDNHIDCAIFDPLIAFHSIKENDNTAMDQMIKGGFGQIAEQTNSCIELSQHTRKPTMGAEITADDSRGGGAAVYAARSVRVLNQMTAKEAEEANIEHDKRKLYVRVKRDKVNLVPPTKANWIHLASERLPNGTDTEPGDLMQVAEKWTYPQTFDGISTDDLRWTRQTARGGTYRADSRANDWIGNQLLDHLKLKRNDKAARKKVRDVLKVWFENGALATVPKPDANRIDRDFVVPGEWDEEPELSRPSDEEMSS